MPENTEAPKTDNTDKTFDPVDPTSLEYEEKGVVGGERKELQLDDMWGKLPFNRWKLTGRFWYVPLTDIATSAAVGDTFHSITIPKALDGAQIIGVEAAVTSASASGGPISIQLAIGANDVLLTPITIDDGEKSSLDAATQPSVSPIYGIVRAKDQIDIDIDDIGDGSAFGWQLYIYFQ